MGVEAFYRCRKMESVELLCDEVNIKKLCFSCSENIQIIAIPNAHEIKASISSFISSTRSKNFVLLIQSGVEIDFIYES